MATVTVCDICGKGPTKTFYFPYDSQYNGVDTEVRTESFDLCFDHTEWLVGVLRGALMPANTAEMIVYVNNKKVIDILLKVSKYKEKD